MHNIIKSFIPLVDFLADVLGDETEIVLHDMTDPDRSVVAIRNGHISGREVGAPATNLALKLLQDPHYHNQDFLSNYKNFSTDGNILKSSTFLIRDEHRKIIGMLCVNSDIENLLNVKRFFDSLTTYSEETNTEKPVEQFSRSSDELTLDSISTIVTEIGVSPSRMHKEEKLEVVRKLYHNGIFLLKGAVSEISDRLKISEASVYRYLNQIRKEEKR